MNKINFAAGVVTLALLGVGPNFNTVAYADNGMSEDNNYTNISVLRRRGSLTDYNKKSFIDGILTFSSLGYNGSINNAKGLERGLDLDIYSWYYENNYFQVVFVEKEENTYIITYNLDKNEEVPSLSEIIKKYNIE